MTARSERIAAAFKWACLAEIDAPKPGNVHVFAPGHRMTARHFVASAEASAAPLCATGERVGARILGAVEATHSAIGTNTNLGIILLCAPLAAAADSGNPHLRAALVEVSEKLDITDASLAFRAIVRAAPAGLGQAVRHDVHAPAMVDLRQAMAEAADRDRVARQYATGFADVFDLGLPVLEAAIARHGEMKWATLAAYLSFLSKFPDSHILRKHGTSRAEEVRARAATLRDALETATRPGECLGEMLRWDAELKESGINPGTSADLTVATLFAHRLQTILPPTRNSG